MITQWLKIFWQWIKNFIYGYLVTIGIMLVGFAMIGGVTYFWFNNIIYETTAASLQNITLSISQYIIWWILWVASLVIIWLAWTLSLCVITYNADNVLHGKNNEPFIPLLKKSRQKTWEIKWKYLWYTLAIFWLTLLWFIPGVIFAIYRFGAMYILILSPKTSLNRALTESKKLVQGKRRNVFGTLVWFGLIIVWASLISDALANLLAELWIATVWLALSFIIDFVITTASYAWILVLYYRLKHLYEQRQSV